MKKSPLETLKEEADKLVPRINDLSAQLVAHRYKGETEEVIRLRREANFASGRLAGIMFAVYLLEEEKGDASISETKPDNGEVPQEADVIRLSNSPGAVD